MLTVPTTPSDVRGFKNWVSEVRRRGGVWPVVQMHSTQPDRHVRSWCLRS